VVAVVEESGMSKPRRWVSSMQHKCWWLVHIEPTCSSSAMVQCAMPDAPAVVASSHAPQREKERCAALPLRTHMSCRASDDKGFRERLFHGGARRSLGILLRLAVAGRQPLRPRHRRGGSRDCSRSEKVPPAVRAALRLRDGL